VRSQWPWNLTELQKTSRCGKLVESLGSVVTSPAILRHPDMILVIFSAWRTLLGPGPIGIIHRGNFSGKQCLLLPLQLQKTYLNDLKNGLWKPGVAAAVYTSLTSRTIVYGRGVTYPQNWLIINKL